MSLMKSIRDKAAKVLFSGFYVPGGLLEWKLYSRDFGGINFRIEQKDGVFFATSNGFRHGSIITSGSSIEDLDVNIRDAILTAFEIPSSYAKEADIKRQGERRPAQETQYVAA